MQHLSGISAKAHDDMLHLHPWRQWNSQQMSSVATEEKLNKHSLARLASDQVARQTSTYGAA
jgi:hypothetical protein